MSQKRDTSFANVYRKQSIGSLMVMISRHSVRPSLPRVNLGIPHPRCSKGGHSSAISPKNLDTHKCTTCHIRRYVLAYPATPNRRRKPPSQRTKHIERRTGLRRAIATATPKTRWMAYQGEAESRQLPHTLTTTHSYRYPIRTARLSLSALSQTQIQM